jgi:hypothetical protein
MNTPRVTAQTHRQRPATAGQDRPMTTTRTTAPKDHRR